MGLDHIIILKVTNKERVYENVLGKDITYFNVKRIDALVMRKEYFIDSFFVEYFDKNCEIGLSNCEEKYFDVSVIDMLIEKITKSNKVEWYWKMEDDEFIKLKNFYLEELDYIKKLYSYYEADNYVSLYYWQWY